MAGVVGWCLAAAVVCAGPGAAENAAQPVGTASFRVESVPSALEGVWELFPGADPPGPGAAEGGVAVGVPGAWERSLGRPFDGHAWYRARFFLKADAAPPGPLGIAFPRIRDADVAVLNGDVIGSMGAFPPHFEKATLYSRVYSLPEASLVRGGWNTLLVHVYNHARRGGMVGRAPVIGPYRELLGALHRETDIILVFAVFFLMVALNHAFLYYHRRAERSNGVFALYGLVSALYLVTFSPLLLPRILPLNTVFRLNVVLMPLTAALFTFFVFIFFDERPPMVVRWMVALVLLDAALAAIWPRLDDLYVTVEAAELVMLLLMTGVAWFLARQMRRRVRYAVPMAVVVGGLFLASGYDILADLGMVVDPPIAVAGMIFPFSFIPFYLVIGMILGHRYSQYYLHSTEDELTGLLQRREFFARLEEELERARRDRRVVVVGVLDLDGFKAINDTYGHAAGDRVLGAVGDVVQEHMRPFDLAGRIGGDELAVALSVPHRLDGAAILERICSGVADLRVRWGGDALKVTASCGAAAWEPEGEQAPTAETMVRSADTAMYRVKSRGGGAVGLHVVDVTASGRVPAVEEY